MKKMCRLSKKKENHHHRSLVFFYNVHLWIHYVLQTGKRN